MTDDLMWALKEASKAGGMAPHSSSTVQLLGFLESRGMVRRSGDGHSWQILPEGRAIADGSKSLSASEIEAFEIFQRVDI